MPIVGTGIDIVECLRIAQMIERHGELFITRVYTDHEIEYCTARKAATQHYAGRWAAKEAVLKALGTGWRRGIGWRDIEIRNDRKRRTDREASRRRPRRDGAGRHPADARHDLPLPQLRRGVRRGRRRTDQSVASVTTAPILDRERATSQSLPQSALLRAPSVRAPMSSSSFVRFQSPPRNQTRLTTAETIIAIGCDHQMPSMPSDVCRDRTYASGN